MSDGNCKSVAGRPGLWVAVIAALAVMHRVTPYVFDLGPEARFAWNFAPVGALGLFAGVRWRSSFAVLTPIAVMLASDLLIWPFLAAKGYPTFGWMTPILYASFMVYALIGRMIRGSSSPLWIGGAAFLGALQFYLVTNFACWVGSEMGMYAMNLGGLAHCYYMALPFFSATLAGDLAFSGLFFGLYALHQRALDAEKTAQPA